MAEPQHTNRLAAETSPYLLQHAHNPVDWYPWGDEALNKARDEDRPILLSVGYSACHWCHVMERESFENAEIAALMNASFVNIKVDREERPDIDHLYMNAVQLLTGQGGWPMTVFLTPEGRPFYGGTYFPPEDRYGRPGFPRILEAVAQAWRDRRDEVVQQSREMTAHVQQLDTLEAPPALVTMDVLDRAFAGLHQAFDGELGGFGAAPKFPQPMALDFLLRFGQRVPDSGATGMALFTLQRMASGGIYDQLGGGFHRYSTDTYWLVPHFEKMLYDNAQLAATYLSAYQLTGEELYRRITVETLDYVLREMTDPDGGFYSTQDADSEGEEGRFFVWKLSEVEEVLGTEDATLFARYYDITPRGNWEKRNILNYSAPMEQFARAIGAEPAAVQQRMDGLRARLLARREERVKPGRDEKILTAWNGLMIAALAQAGAALEREDYLATAQRGADFILRELYRDGRLLRTGKRDADGAFRAAEIPGFLEDYAFFAFALVRLFEADGDWRWMDSAVELTDTMQELFGDGEGGLYTTASDAAELIGRPREVTDSAIPAGSSVAADLLLRLAAITGDEDYRAAAERLLSRLNAAMGEHPLAFGRALCAADLLIGPTLELAVVGKADDPGTAALLREARRTFQPRLFALWADPDEIRSASSPILSDRPVRDGKATAYLCRGYACQTPTTDPAELARQLEGEQNR